MAKKRKPAPKPDSSSEEEEEQPQIKEESSDDNEEADEEDDDDDDDDDDEEEDSEDEEEEEEEDEDEDEEDEEEDLSSREALRKILEPFGKDQLIELLKEAALKNPSIVTSISESAKSDPVHRKIFVHGLGWDATTQTLASAFSQYGDIEECKVVVDRSTGRSKGYGFVLFRTRAGARKALKEPQKMIGGRTTSCQLASFGAPKGINPTPEATGRKVFISNIGPNVNPERLRAFFAKFGEIEDGPLGYDRATGKLRGFAIFVYKTVEGCKKALEEPIKVFEGCELHCQRALEGLKPKTAVVGGLGLPTPAVLQPNDLALTYASASMMGMNPVAGLVGQSLTPAAAGFVGQNAGVGLLNPAAGLSPSVNRSSTTPSSYGIGSGVNSVSPSVIGSYQSQAALQGLGAYQSSHLPSTMTPGMRSQSGIGSYGAGFPPYLRR